MHNWRPSVTRVSQPKRVPEASDQSPVTKQTFVGEKGLPEFPPGVPVQLANEPELDIVSDASLRTVRCASDRLSSDTLAGLVRMQSTAALMSGTLHWPNSRQSKQSDTKKRQAVQERVTAVQKSSNNYTAVSVQRSAQRQISESDSQQLMGDGSYPAESTAGNVESPSREVAGFERRSSPTQGDIDFSVLLQALVGHVYGSDCQRVGNSRKISVQTADPDSEPLSATASVLQQHQHLDDCSDLMTLTCGDASQTLLTQLCKHLQGQANSAGRKVTPTNVSAEKEDIPKERFSLQRLKNGHSNLSLAGSDLDQTLATTALLPPPASQFSAIVEAIPPSDRVGKKVDADEQKEPDADDDAVLSIGSTRNNDLTVESKVVLDMGSFANPDEDTGYCNCSARTNSTTKKSRHRRKQQRHKSPSLYDPSSNANDESRFGRLRTPDLCITPARYDLKHKHKDEDAASSFTAAMVEWDEQKRRAYNRRKASSSSRDKTAGHAKSRGSASGRQRMSSIKCRDDGKKRSDSRQTRFQKN